MAAIQKIIQLGRDNKIPANVQIKDLKRIYIENQQSFLVPSTE
jgi:hypothetical protein